MFKDDHIYTYCMQNVHPPWIIKTNIYIYIFNKFQS